LHYAIFLPFSQKKISLATLAQLHFIHKLEMQVCNVILPTPTAVIFACISVLFLLTVSIQNAARVQNVQKSFAACGSAQDPVGGASFLLKVMGATGGRGARQEPGGPRIKNG